MRLTLVLWLSAVVVIATLAGSACLQQPAAANLAQQFEQPLVHQWPPEAQVADEESADEAASGQPADQGAGVAPTPGFTEENIPPPSALPSGMQSPTASVGASPGATMVPSATATPLPGTTSPGLPTAAPPAAGELPMPRGLLSEAPLPAAVISSASNPANRVGLGLVEQARQAIADRQPDYAIRLLGRALSVDPVDPYVYFYLGRAYLDKGNYEQALTFWQRAVIGFGTNAPWLGETYGFEGLAQEQMGRIADARIAYQKALAVAPGNALAQLGYARLGPPPLPEPAPGSESTSGLGAGGPPPPVEATPAPAPEEPPPPAAP
jgi:TolA-binding protein